MFQLIHLLYIELESLNYYIMETEPYNDVSMEIVLYNYME